MRAASNETDRTYEARLLKLERQLRWTRLALITMAAIFGITFAITRTKNFTRVNAQEFVLKDSSGRIRAKLAMLHSEPGLKLYAASGEERVDLAGGGEDAGLSLYLPVTASQTSSAGFSVYEGEKQIASLSGGPSSTKLLISSASGTGTASIFAKQGVATMGLDANPQQGSGLILQAAEDASCLAAHADEANSQASGASMCLDSQGHPSLMLNGRKGHSTILGVAPANYQRSGANWGNNAASLALTANNGKVLWSEPR
jgi:hypothetical protein